MNHLNKQLEVNHATLEQYLAEQDRKDRVQQRLDRLGLSLMILCGLIGLFYCIANANTIFKKSKKDALGVQFPSQPYQYAIAGISHTNLQEKAAASNKEVEHMQSFVNISGTPRAGETLQFLLDAYDQEAEYKLLLGNGDTRQVQTNQMAYTYAQAGSYEVILEVSYQGETAVAFSKILTID